MKKSLGLLSILATSLLLSGCGEPSSLSSALPTSSAPTSQPSSQQEQSSAIDFTTRYTDGALSFVKQNDEDISVVDPNHPEDEDAIATVVYQLSSLSGVTEAKFSIATSNPKVLPLSAITHEYTNVSTSNVINGGALTIDLTKVQEGESYLRLDFKGLNGNSASGYLVKKITVKAFGEVATNHVKETLVFDYSKVTETKSLNALKDSTAKITIINQDVPYGSDIFTYRYMTIAAIYDETSKKQTVEFETLVGAKVFFNIARPRDDDPDRPSFYEITKETKTSSFEQTKSFVVFQQEGLTVTISVGNAKA